MSNNEGIFSLRLVIADFYMEKPVAGLDPCYSEFRGKEIKRVSKNINLYCYKYKKVIFVCIIIPNKKKGTSDTYIWA